MRNRLPSAPKLVVGIAILSAVVIVAIATGVAGKLVSAFGGGTGVEVPAPAWVDMWGEPSGVATSQPTEDMWGASTDAAAPWGQGMDSSLNVGEARQALDRLVVRPEGSMDGFSRDKFGPQWADVDHNGCDTRNDILARDLTDVTFRAGTHDCVVETGTLAYEPYTGRTDVQFVKGGSLDQSLDIEHVVALGQAWASGAATWDAESRRQYANDPLVLFTADPSANRAKGDASADEWLPENQAYQCTYVERQIEIKERYSLSVTPAEKNTMGGVLDDCRS